MLNCLRGAAQDSGATIAKDRLSAAGATDASAQVDSIHYGLVPIGNTRRRLSFFVMGPLGGPVIGLYKTEVARTQGH